MDSSPWYTVLYGILIVGLTAIISSIGVFIVRRTKSYKILGENNEFAGITYPVVGLVYGVFLAFTIIIAWEKFSEAEHSVVNEVTHLSELWRHAQSFDDGQRDLIQDKLYAYVKDVKDKEWETMSKRGYADEDTKNSYEEIWNCYYDYEPRGEHQIAFFSETISHLSEVGQYRRQRIMFSSYEIPGIMWGFVIIGGIITISLNYLIGTRNTWAQATINSLIAGLIAFSIFLVFSLQRPFTGDVSVQKAPFETLLKSFDERIKKQRGQ